MWNEFIYLEVMYDENYPKDLQYIKDFWRAVFFIMN